ncbi:hypothetical protein HOLleu_37667 [Holothuria leucospilota]|uniref:Uncharacterized protein n=1 Tax=Holothuria leucospilota TaxID=206669 RepID=A0A9Q1BFG6_HOLLE|nr:hypothetical protein HOLleu_37667 [Holothuria leucospilota]
MNDNMEKVKSRQKKYYDKSAKPLPPLQQGDTVRIAPPGYDKGWKRGTIAMEAGVRSYIVDKDDGTQIRRNRKHLRKVNEPTASCSHQTNIEDDETQSS